MSITSKEEYFEKSGLSKKISQPPDVFMNEKHIKKGKDILDCSKCKCEKCEILYITHAIIDDHIKKYFGEQCHCSLCKHVHLNYYEFGCEKSIRKK